MGSALRSLHRSPRPVLACDFDKEMNVTWKSSFPESHIQCIWNLFMTWADSEEKSLFPEPVLSFHLLAYTNRPVQTEE